MGHPTFKVEIMKSIKITLFAFFVAFGISTKAQNDFTLYQMRAIPQVTTVNPSAFPLSKVNIGLPVISGTYLSFGNSGFAYSDAVRLTDDDSLEIDLDNAIDRMSDRNIISSYTRTDLFSLGFKAANNYFSIGITEVFDTRFFYPRGLFEFLWFGNGGSNLGQRISFNGLGLDFIHYRKIGLGWARRIGPNLTVGARFNYLYGGEAIYFSKSQLGIATDPIDYSLTVDNGMEVNTSGIRRISDISSGGSVSTDDILDYLLRGNNTGYSIDAGFNYELFDLFNISGSVIDLGSINWRDDLETYTLEGGEFTFDGVDLFSLVDPIVGETSASGLQNLVDSATNFFTDFDTLPNKSFSTPLSPQIYAGVTYNLTNRVRLGVLSRSQFIKGDLSTSLSASLSATVGNFFSTSLNYSVYGRSLGNLGVGLSFNLAPIQIYVITDNAFVAFQPYNVKNTHLRFGLNLTFGRDYEL